MLTPQEMLLMARAASLFANRSRKSVSQFCMENFYLPKTLTARAGPIRFNDMEYLIDPLDAWGDDSLSDIDYCFATQVAKTTLIMCGMGWSILNRPMNTLWILATMPQARSFNRRRWHVFVKANECLRREMPADSDYFTLTEQHFLKCFVKFAGSHSIAELIESPMGRVVYDEIDSAPAKPGQASPSQLADERTKTYRDAMRIKASSPGKEPSTIWDSAHKGTFERYSVRCPRCETPFFLDWRDKDGGYFIKWDPRARLPSGKWDKACVRETAHYECPKCKKQLNDGDKVMMLRKSHGAAWLATNPNPAPRHRSFQLGSIYSPWVTFAGMAEKWIDSSDSIYGLQIFINGWLGEVFGQVEAEEVTWPESDYGMCRVTPADASGFVMENPDPWPLATHRLMGIDRQAGRTDAQTGIKDSPHLKLIIREFNAQSGASRRIWAGRVQDEDEARGMQWAFGIGDTSVFMDHGFEGNEVTRICAKFGWIALKGDDRDKFYWVEENHGRKPIQLWMPYAKKSKIDAFTGNANQGHYRKVTLHLWSNPTIYDALHSFMTGHGPEWKLPRDVTEDQLQQLASMAKKKKFIPSTGQEKHQWVRVKDKHGVPLPNDDWDIEAMLLVGAMIRKIKFSALASATVDKDETT